MRLRLAIIVAICLLAAPLMSLPAGAQCTIQQLNGTTWAFQTTDFADAAVGIFTAQVAPNPRSPSVLQGQLSVLESANNQGAIQRQNKVAGLYTVEPDCSGGVLYLMGSENAYQYRFVFAAGGTQMFLLTSNPSVGNNMSHQSFASGQSWGNRGKAVKLPATPSCGGADPLAGKWSFEIQDATTGAIGIMTAASGTLTVAESVSGSTHGMTGIGVTGNGIYQVDPDCSGGTLILNNGQNNVYAFVFAGPNEIYMVSMTPNSVPAFGPPLLGSSGIAVRY